MEKLSPLKASLETFRQFRTQRAEKNENTKTHSNPFGITFKGTMLNMDVFDSSKTKGPSSNGLQERMQSIGKFVASARVATMNKFSQMKQSMISFGGQIKQDAREIFEKVKNPKTYDVFNLQNSVAFLGKRSVQELEGMLKDALVAEGV